MSEEHASVKVKEEPTQNKVLRALMSATTEKYHITTGKQAVEMLLTSARIKEVTVIVHTRMVCGFMYTDVQLSTVIEILNLFVSVSSL